MASSLIDSMAGDFDPDQFTDSYREALQEVIDVKVGKRETVTRPTTEEKVAPTIDLMAELRESVERARSGRAPSGKTATVTPIKKTAPKKAAPKKAAEKKAAPKKAASAKKTTKKAPTKRKAA